MTHVGRRGDLVVWCRRACLAALLLAAAWWLGVSTASVRAARWEPRSDRPRLLVTIHPLLVIARQVAGPHAEVRCLMPPGADPHELALTPSLVRLADGADIVVSHGSGLDDFIVDALERAGVRHRPAVATRGLALLPALGHDAHEDENGRGHGGHEHGPDDPHAWLDPLRVPHYARALAGPLADELRRRNQPDAARDVEARVAAMTAEVRALHTEYMRRLAPHRGKAIMAFHGALRYVAARYDIRLAGAWQETPGREPAARDVGRLLARARAEGVSALLAEPQFSRRALEVIAADADLPVVLFDPMEAASLGDRRTYVDVMRGNLDALATALQRSRAPVGGH